MIPQNFIEEVQSKTDIVELISPYLHLKKAGRNFKAACPFHGEKTPSFMVSPQKQIFHCFGCGAGGGAVQFIMLQEKTTFPEAIEILAKRLGMEVPNQKSDTESHKLKTNLVDAVSEASLFFHKNLCDENNKPVLDYLYKRGINQDIIKRFKLGYAAGRNTLLDYLRKKGFTLEALEKASLVIAKETGYRDIFNDQVMFPIFDIRGQAIAFGARLWKNIKDAPKYINSIENPIYSKREHLFGLNFSKEHIINEGWALIVEGYLDMITPFACGIKNIAASLGTSLTIEQIKLLKRYSTNITLMYDSDKAGQAATLRAIDLLLENGLNVKVAAPPEGLDPDSLAVSSGEKHFREVLAERKDFFDYKLGVLQNNFNPQSIEGKSKIAKEMFLTLEKIRSEVERYEYIKKLSLVIRVKEEIMFAEWQGFISNKNKPWRPAQEIKVSAQRNNAPISITEKILIKFILNNDKAFSLVRDNVHEEDFSSPIARKTASYIFKNYPHGTKASLTFFNTIEDKEINDFISEIIIDESVPLDKEIFKSSLLKMRRKHMKSLCETIQTEISAAQAAGDKEKIKELLNKHTEAANAAR